MDYIRQNRIMGWSIVVLVLLNGLALGTLWWTSLGPAEDETLVMGQRPGRGIWGRSRMRRGQEGPADVAGFMERELGFDPNQTEALRTLRTQFLEDNFEVRQSIHGLKRSMMQTLFARETDPNAIAELADRIGQQHTRLEMIQSNHFEQIRSLCKPEQKDQFMRLLDDIMKMTRPEAPGPMGPGRGGPMRGGRRGPMGEFPRGPGPGGPPEGGF